MSMVAEAVALGDDTPAPPASPAHVPQGPDRGRSHDEAEARQQHDVGEVHEQSGTRHGVSAIQHVKPEPT